MGQESFLFFHAPAVPCVCCRSEAAYNQALLELGVGLDAEPAAIHTLMAPEFPQLTRQVRQPGTLVD